MTLAISTAKVDISPPVGTPLAGYGVDTPRLSTGSNAPLYVRCTVLWDGGSPNVIATADTLVVTRAMNQAVRARVLPLMAPLGGANSDFVLTATHTHNSGAVGDELVPQIAYNIAPATPEMAAITAYTQAVEDALVLAVQNALGAPQIACTLDYQLAAQSFSFNREGLPYVETAVPVLCARSLSGALLAVLFGYGCHPVAAGAQTLSDPDYPGVACALIEASGAFAHFLTGAAGDQDPPGDRSFAPAATLGQGLGQAVLTASATLGRAVAGPIRTAYRDLTLPLDITNTAANLAAVRADFASRAADTILSGYVRRHAAAMMGQIDAGTFATFVPLPVQVWTLDGLLFALTGGELVSGYAVYLRNRHGGAAGIWASGYGNEIPCYIPSLELLQSGGALQYACGWYADFPGIGGGAMTVYGQLAHFPRTPATDAVNVEKIILGALEAML